LKPVWEQDASARKKGKVRVKVAKREPSEKRFKAVVGVTARKRGENEREEWGA